MKLLRYVQFQHLQTLPYWKLLVISFFSSLGSTLLPIKKSYNWPPILVGHQWGRTKEMGSHINVCAIYDIQFAPMNCLLLGSATEMVSQIKVCVIYGIRFTRTNYFWLGNTTEMVQLNKMCVIRAKQPTRMNCLRWEITTQTVNTVSSCAILCVQKTLKNAN